jgi:hypothetical protein
MQSGKLISQARQHPEVQLRQWLETMSFSRARRKVTKPDDPANDLFAKVS